MSSANAVMPLPENRICAEDIQLGSRTLGGRFRAHRTLTSSAPVSSNVRELIRGLVNINVMPLKIDNVGKRVRHNKIITRCKYDVMRQKDKERACRNKVCKAEQCLYIYRNTHV
ncbi:uncharacterized protein LOC114942597 [Nylanderia fulva]|uniref:uncharacterized protein LOC114942597 n=1 Tax=Nylanderia fulva TaxID=613905 RepID=UPI0010FAE1DD|nr:uncharacterized protein LOC114942597 [Nylanderia fulva]